MIKMPWLWLILAGIITVALVSYVLVIGLGNLMIHRDWSKLVREEMASVEKEYRDLCGHLLRRRGQVRSHRPEDLRRCHRGARPAAWVVVILPVHGVAMADRWTYVRRLDS